MRRSWGLLLLLPWLAAAPAAAAPSRDAVDRGHLSLAWDAHDAGLTDEALGYLGQIRPGSVVAADALRLRTECLLDLGRFPEAAEALEAPSAATLAGRDALLLDVYWAWAWDATGREAYAEALGVAERGLRALPGELELAAFAEASRFRAAVATALARGDARTASGEELMIRA
ncbi:MAG: hypothetical protein ACYDA8_16820, partial [Deferrisomatales bacterium]